MELRLKTSYDILQPKKSDTFVCITSLIWKNPTKLKDNEMGKNIPATVVGGTSGGLVVKNLPAVLETQVQSLVGELRCNVPHATKQLSQ